MKKVLVVDDELSVANFITDVVHMMGFEAKVLTNGTKVLSTAKEWKPDLITLDIMMPSPDGVEVLSQIKNDPETANIPVFVVSVVANKPEITAKLSQAQKIFSKPINTKDLIAGLRESVNPNKPK